MSHNNKIYFLPASDGALGDKIFSGNESLYKGGITNFPFWLRLKKAADKLGIEMHTYDFWRGEDGGGKKDILLVQNHPAEPWPWRLFYFLKHFRSRGGFMLRRRKWLLENYRFFARKFFLQTESPMVTLYIYKRLKQIEGSRIYDKIFLISRPEAWLPKGETDKSNFYGTFSYFDYRGDDFASPYFNNHKEKFLVMINTNAVPHGLRNEFYGERLKAIKYFSNSPDFDLYGYRWDRAPKHPLYFHYGRYVRKTWRGTTPDKLKTTSEYKFTLCFENCAYPGYVSEKIFDCLAVGSIPIYLGAPDITSVVPESCFIDFRKFSVYPELDKFLRGFGEEDIDKYRNSIRNFIQDTSGRKTIESFVKEIVE